MNFQFVDSNGAIDRTTRKKIRSHVAIGRNAGRTVKRPSKTKAFNLKKTTTRPSHPNSLLVCSPRNYQTLAQEIVRPVCSGLSALPFPDLTPESTDLAKRAFSFMSEPRHVPELRKAFEVGEGTTSLFARLMLLDEAYFHCAIAVSITALNSLCVMQVNPTEALNHLSCTFRLVNKRFCNSMVVSDGTIAVILSMTHYERMRGEYRQGAHHLEGLQQIIKLRGGIFQFSNTEPRVAQKIFRADLEYSLLLGSSTRFSVEDMAKSAAATIELPGSFGTSYTALNSRILEQLSEELQALLVDVKGLALILTEASSGRRKKLNSYAFHNTLLLLGYRLISLNSLCGNRLTNQLENLVHLGLAAFITTLLRGLDWKIPNNPILSGLIRAATESYKMEQENGEVLLWMLFIGAASLSLLGEKHDAWLVSKAKQTVRMLDLYSWDGIPEKLQRFPWVSILHDKAGEALFSEL